MDIIAQYYFQYKIWRCKWLDARKSGDKNHHLFARQAYEYRKVYHSAKYGNQYPD